MCVFLQSVQANLVTLTECRRMELLQIKTVLRSLFPTVHVSDDESVRILTVL